MGTWRTFKNSTEQDGGQIRSVNDARSIFGKAGNSPPIWMASLHPLAFGVI
jgi:hypothetical protein